MLFIISLKTIKKILAQKSQLHVGTAPSNTKTVNYYLVANTKNDGNPSSKFVLLLCNWHTYSYWIMQFSRAVLSSSFRWHFTSHLGMERALVIDFYRLVHNCKRLKPKYVNDGNPSSKFVLLLCNWQFSYWMMHDDAVLTCSFELLFSMVSMSFHLASWNGERGSVPCKMLVQKHAFCLSLWILIASSEEKANRQQSTYISTYFEYKELAFFAKKSKKARKAWKSQKTRC